MNPTLASQEHRAKYEALAQELGIEALKALVPATNAQITAALARGDEHLNTIPLHRWDTAAAIWSCVPKQDAAYFLTRTPCPTCKEGYVYTMPPTPDVWKKRRLTLSERVCVLKHVARYYGSHKQEPKP